MLKQLILLLLISSISCNPIKTARVQLNEELDADTQLVNLTELIHSLLNRTTPIRSIKFSAPHHQTDLNDYFRIDTKQLSFSSRIVNSIDLKTSSKRLDRELVCATAQADCVLTLKLTAQLEDAPDLEVDVPIQINDINDNKPAFHQPEIKIDIDLNKSVQILKIPLKQAYDLDSSYANRVQNYSLSRSFNNQMQIRHNQRSLVLIINTTDLDVNKRELVELRAFDPDFEATQLIELNFNLKPKFQIFERNFFNLTHAQPIRVRLNKTTNQQCEPEFTAYNAKSNKPIRAEFRLADERFLELTLSGRLAQVRLVAKCGDLNDTAFLILNDLVNSSVFNLNLVSAMNDLDINETHNAVEFKFKLTQLDAVESSSVTNSSFVTLAYLIAEQQQPQLNGIKYKLNREINKLDDNYHDLIKIDEMRNGLYAFKLSAKYLDIVKLLNSPNLDKRMMPPSVAYTLRLNLLVNEPDLAVQRVIKLNLPSLHLIQTNSDLTRKSSTTSSVPPVTAATLLANFNLFNSVVLITIISVVLIVIALGCFVISLSLYLKSKCKQMNEIKKVSKKEDLIEVKLSEKKLYSESSIESGISSGQPSSASSTSDLSCNNSTITTTTHNGFQQQQQTGRSSWVNNNAIMVYDVMPSKSNQSSSASSSSSSSSNYQNSSNVSPVTTTSGVESAVSNSSSIRNTKQSLLQLSAKQLESDYENNSKESKDVMYKWYMNTTTTTNELVRPLPVKPSTDTCDASMSSLNTDYRNEIYRNSHLIFKNNAQYCQLKKSLPSAVSVRKQSDEQSHKSQEFKTYEAKPINVNDVYSTASNSNANYNCTTTATTISNNMNSASSLDNYDTVNFDSVSANSINFVSNALNREKLLFNRLSTANSVASSSENSSSQARVNTYAKVSLSMLDPEQQISSV